MMARLQHIQDLNDLKNYVHQTICDQNELELECSLSPSESWLGAAKPCGIFFCLYGPRSVKFTAIWETERNTILFYGSSGERIMKTQLTHAPRLVNSEACGLGRRKPRSPSHGQAATGDGPNVSETC